jgi:hypothetical protein
MFHWHFPPCLSGFSYFLFIGTMDVLATIESPSWQDDQHQEQKYWIWLFFASNVQGHILTPLKDVADEKDNPFTNLQ